MQEIPLIIAPDPDEPAAAEVLIDGTVNGRLRRFLLDTGAAHTGLLADPLMADLATVGTEASHGAVSGSTDEVVRISELTVGPLRAQDLKVIRIPAEQRGARDLLGMDVLAHVCCRIELSQQRLCIETSPHAGAVNPLLMDDRNHCYVDLDWADAQAQACFDTGAGLTIVDQAFIDKHPHLFELAGTSTGIDATGGSVETPLFLMAGPTIGGTQFAAHPVAALDLAPVNATLELPMDLILGYPTIRQANWLFDFPARRWSVSRAASR